MNLCPQKDCLYDLYLYKQFVWGLYIEAIKNFYALYSSQEQSIKEISEYRAVSMEAVKSQKNRDIRYNAIINFINAKHK